MKSSAKTATLKNGGTATLTGITISETGATSSFAESNTCATTLAAGASCTFTVTFDPSAAVAKTLTVTIKDSVGTQTLEASGTGVAGGTIAFNPTSIAFGNETVGVKSAAKTTTLTNNTGVAVTGVAVSLTGATSSFTETNNCGTTLANGASCTFTVTFDPNGAEAKTLTISVKDSAGTQTLVASGTGVAATGSVVFNPTSIAFGNQTVGVKSAAKTTTLTNNTAAAVTGCRYR